MQSIVDQIMAIYDDNKSGGGGVVVGLANSAAIEKMRMHESARQGGGGGSGGGRAAPTQPREPKADATAEPPVKREREATARAAADGRSGAPDGAQAKREEGEIEDGPLPPPTKRAREREP